MSIRVKKVFRMLEEQDFKVLNAIERGMRKHEFVPQTYIAALSGFPIDEVNYRLGRLGKWKLIQKKTGPYLGYRLNFHGYDCLALNAFVKADIIVSIGSKLGVGKEADVFECLTQKEEKVALKFFRFGMVFRSVKKVRVLEGERVHTSWLYESRIAAQREFKALNLANNSGVSVPKPFKYNRHAIVMENIEGEILAKIKALPDPVKILEKILYNVKITYNKAKIIHSDLSEHNVVITPEEDILIIDWPQFVVITHPNSEFLLRRDLENIINFFHRKFHIEKLDVQTVLEYIWE